jgi:hypothetical protein
MSTYSVLHAFFLTWFSKDFYRDVRANWSLGKSFGALALVLALVWLPLTYGIYRAAVTLANKHAVPLLEQVPEIILKDGQASLSVKQPFFITIPDAPDPVAILDTTGKVTSLDGYPKTSLLLTKTELIMRKSGNRIEAVPLTQKMDIVLTRDRFRGWMMALLTWLPFALYPIVFLFSLAYRFIQALIYGALGSLIANVQKINLDYGVILKLAMVSLIPAILFKTLFSVLNYPLPMQWIFGLALGMGYLIFAIRANRPDDTPPTPIA